jgi:hypothetical protein
LAVLARRLIAPLPVLAALLASCGGSGSSGDDAAKAIAGDWTGTLTQEGLKPFRIAVRIETSGDGQVAYTGIDCGGKWDLRSVESGTYTFTEKIDEGAGGECKGSGEVSVKLDSKASGSRLDYEFTGGGVTSRGVLDRTDAAGLEPIFDEAGVDPPS